MKYLIVTAIMILNAVVLHAQKITEGSFSVLTNESAVLVKIDYTNSTIAKVPFDIFQEEENWDEGYKDILKKFVLAANRKSKGLKYSPNKSANYLLVFKAIKVDNDGETRGTLLLLDKDNNTIGVAERFHARGGKFGSQMNLMGDASERLGKKVALFINRHKK